MVYNHLILWASIMTWNVWNGPCSVGARVSTQGKIIIHKQRGGVADSWSAIRTCALLLQYLDQLQGNTDSLHSQSHVSSHCLLFLTREGKCVLTSWLKDSWKLWLFFVCVCVPGRRWAHVIAQEWRSEVNSEGVDSLLPLWKSQGSSSSDQLWWFVRAWLREWYYEEV